MDAVKIAWGMIPGGGLVGEILGAIAGALDLVKLGLTPAENQTVAIPVNSNTESPHLNIMTLNDSIK